MTFSLIDFLDALRQRLSNPTEHSLRSLHALNLAEQDSLAPPSTTALTLSSPELSDLDSYGSTSSAWRAPTRPLPDEPTQLFLSQNFSLDPSFIDQEETNWNQQDVAEIVPSPRFELLKNGRGGGNKNTTDPVDPANGLQSFEDIGIERRRGRYVATLENIRPWGVQAVWQSESGAPEGVDFSDYYAFVLDTGFSKKAAADFNIATTLAKNFTGDLTNDLVLGYEGNDYWNDLNSHGTHVAGTIGAMKGTPDDPDWDFSVEGVVPGAQIVPIKVLDDNGSGAFQWIYNGLSYAIDTIKTNNLEDSSVINLSLGAATQWVDDYWEELFSPLFTAVENADITFVVAAGNESTEAEVGNFFATFGDLDNVYVSTAVDQDYELASFSNYDALLSNGGDDTDYSSPGVDVWSTSLSGGATRMSGTSMSSPHLAGSLLANIAGFSTNDLMPMNGEDYAGGYEDPFLILSVSDPLA